MARNISKICSFCLLFLLLVLTLNQLKIMSYSDTIKNIFYFLTLIFMIVSCITSLLSTESGFFKFLSGLIIVALIGGGILYIMKPVINIALYSCLILTTIYCMVDMFYKPS